MPPIVQRLLVPFSRGGGGGQNPSKSFWRTATVLFRFSFAYRFLFCFSFILFRLFFGSFFCCFLSCNFIVVVSVFCCVFYSLLCARGLKCETCRNFFIDLRHSCTSVAATRGARVEWRVERPVNCE